MIVNRRLQKGFGLIELMLSVVVVVVLTSVLAMMYRSAEKNRAVTGFLVELMQIEQSIRDQYKSQLDFTGLSFIQVYQSGFIPPDLQFPGSQTRGKLPWGLQWGVNTLASTPTGTDYGATIGFSFFLPDMATCETVVRQLAPRSTWMLEITTNTVITLPPVPGTPRDLPTINAAVDAACNAVFGAGSGSAQAFIQYATI